MNESIRTRHIAKWLLVACGVWLVSLGFYFIFLRPPLLPEDPRFMGSSLEQVRAAIPGLEVWLKRVFIVMGGFMAGTGILTIFVACAAMPVRLKGTSWAIALCGVLTVALMSLVNFDLHSDFKWVLLAPALIWLSGLALHITDREAADAPNLFNERHKSE